LIGRVDDESSLKDVQHVLRCTVWYWRQVVTHPNIRLGIRFESESCNDALCEGQTVIAKSGRARTYEVVESTFQPEEKVGI
jgi:hypothetical protein